MRRLGTYLRLSALPIVFSPLSFIVTEICFQCNQSLLTGTQLLSVRVL